MVAQTKPAPVQIDDNDSEEVKALKRQMMELQQANQTLAEKAKANKRDGTFTVKVNEVGPKKDPKGKVIPGELAGGNTSIYGLGRFPVSLFGSQTVRLCDPVNQLTIVKETLDNFHLLRFKGGTEAEQAVESAAVKAELIRLVGIYTKVVEEINKGKAAPAKKS